MRALKIKVDGRVQGVGFRFFILKKAEDLGIKGFAKNMPDGSVLIEAQGEEKNMDVFLTYCRQGPSLARVTKMNVSDIPPSTCNDFQIKR